MSNTATANTAANTAIITSFADPLPLPATGMVVDPTGLIGLRRGEDGLIHAIGAGQQSVQGVEDAVAQTLCMLWMPELDQMMEVIEGGRRDIAEAEAEGWIRKWDLFAPGEAEMVKVSCGV